MVHSPEFLTDERPFKSWAPGYWQDKNIAPSDWNSWAWQMRNRITSLRQLEEHLVLSEEERAGVILSGNKLALAITPHFFNLIHPTDPNCPIRRQVVPRVEETWENADEMSDPCGEDSHMPVQDSSTATLTACSFSSPTAAPLTAATARAVA